MCGRRIVASVGQPLRTPRIRAMRKEQAPGVSASRHQLPHARSVSSLLLPGRKWRETAPGLGTLGQRTGNRPRGKGIAMLFLYALRYFQILAVVPPLFNASFIVLAATAPVRLTTNPSMGKEALEQILQL